MGRGDVRLSSKSLKSKEEIKTIRVNSQQEESPPPYTNFIPRIIHDFYYLINKKTSQRARSVTALLNPNVFAKCGCKLIRSLSELMSF